MEISNFIKIYGAVGLYFFSQQSLAEPEFLIMRHENKALRYDYKLDTNTTMEVEHKEEKDKHSQTVKQELKATFVAFDKKLIIQQEFGLPFETQSSTDNDQSEKDKTSNIEYSAKTEIKSKIWLTENLRIKPRFEYFHGFNDEPSDYEIRTPLELSERLQVGRLTIKPFIQSGIKWDYTDEKGEPTLAAQMLGAAITKTSSLDEGEYIWGHRHDLGLSLIFNTKVKTYLSVWSEFHTKKQPRETINTATGAIRYTDRSENKTENHIELIVRPTKYLSIRNEFVHFQDGYYGRVARKSKYTKYGNYENTLKLVYHIL